MRPEQEKVHDSSESVQAETETHTFRDGISLLEIERKKSQTRGQKASTLRKKYWTKTKKKKQMEVCICLG